MWLGLERLGAVGLLTRKIGCVRDAVPAAQRLVKFQMNDPSQQLSESQIQLLEAKLGDSPLDLCHRARHPRSFLASFECTLDIVIERPSLVVHAFCALRRIAFIPNSFLPGLWDSELARGQDVSQQPGQALCTRVCSSLKRFSSAGLTDSRSRGATRRV